MDTKNNELVLPSGPQQEESRSEIVFRPGVTLHQAEKEYILSALNHFGGNKTKAAGALGVTIKTLYNKIHSYGLAEEMIRTPSKSIWSQS